MLSEHISSPYYSNQAHPLPPLFSISFILQSSSISSSFLNHTNQRQCHQMVSQHSPPFPIQFPSHPNLPNQTTDWTLARTTLMVHTESHQPSSGPGHHLIIQVITSSSIIGSSPLLAGFGLQYLQSQTLLTLKGG